jgi:hypothetical protein
MRAIEGFILGAIAGAATVWFWKPEIESYVVERTRGVRELAVAGLQAVEQGAEKLYDRGGAALHRAEDLLKDTKTDVTTALGEEEGFPVRTH